MRRREKNTNGRHFDAGSATQGGGRAVGQEEGYQLGRRGTRNGIQGQYVFNSSPLGRKRPQRQGSKRVWNEKKVDTLSILELCGGGEIYPLIKLRLIVRTRRRQGNGFWGIRAKGGEGQGEGKLP